MAEQTAGLVCCAVGVGLFDGGPRGRGDGVAVKERHVGCYLECSLVDNVVVWRCRYVVVVLHGVEGELYRPPPI